MTLILGMANSRYALQLSDRRLSWMGYPTTEQSNKATALICANARVALGFAGIAMVGNFRTEDAVVDTLSSYDGPRYDLRSIIEWLAERLSAQFASNPALQGLPQRARCLSLMGTGFVGVGDNARYVNLLVTNFQDADAFRDADQPWAAFRTWWWRPKSGVSNPTHIQRIGAWRATTLEDLHMLREALERDVPAQELVRMGVRYIRAVADRPKAANAVGKSVSSIVVPHDGNSMHADFHPHQALDVVFGVNHVVLLPDGGVSFKDVKVRRTTPTGDTMFVPKVGRNKPCPCGSGKKYKRCHGA